MLAVDGGSGRMHLLAGNEISIIPWKSPLKSCNIFEEGQNLRLK